MQSSKHWKLPDAWLEDSPRKVGGARQPDRDVAINSGQGPLSANEVVPTLGGVLQLAASATTVGLEFDPEVFPLLTASIRPNRSFGRTEVDPRAVVPGVAFREVGAVFATCVSREHDNVRASAYLCRLFFEATALRFITELASGVATGVVWFGHKQVPFLDRHLAAITPPNLDLFNQHLTAPSSERSSSTERAAKETSVHPPIIRSVVLRQMAQWPDISASFSFAQDRYRYSVTINSGGDGCPLPELMTAIIFFLSLYVAYRAIRAA
ncbi:hypothetical protein FA15DRAFT_660692 [Coprinopsis marcescibilis]|uniref:Uncharacterized protein n=1 Tax=Coprinopsis marcescibilis TaxID=230819 RepID=A0A5C3KFA1_COPMA|nr:hypothetical protein FA15DRAFT_660692 [Coprinopsis marcescibilis]